MGVGAEKRQCLSPAPFSAHRKFAQIRLKPARNPSLRLGCYPPRNNRTQRLTRANKGDFCVECLLDDTTSRRKRMCAFTACVRFLRRRGPVRLRKPYSLVTAWSFLHFSWSGQQQEFSIKTIRRPNVHCKTECILLQYSKRSLEWRRYTICPLSSFETISRK